MAEEQVKTENKQVIDNSESASPKGAQPSSSVKPPASVSESTKGDPTKVNLPEIAPPVEEEKEEPKPSPIKVNPATYADNNFESKQAKMTYKLLQRAAQGDYSIIKKLNTLYSQNLPALAAMSPEDKQRISEYSKYVSSVVPNAGDEKIARKDIGQYLTSDTAKDIYARLSSGDITNAELAKIKENLSNANPKDFSRREAEFFRRVVPEFESELKNNYSAAQDFLNEIGEKQNVSPSFLVDMRNELKEKGEVGMSLDKYKKYVDDRYKDYEHKLQDDKKNADEQAAKTELLNEKLKQDRIKTRDLEIKSMNEAAIKKQAQKTYDTLLKSKNFPEDFKEYVGVSLLKNPELLAQDPVKGLNNLWKSYAELQESMPPSKKERALNFWFGIDPRQKKRR